MDRAVFSAVAPAREGRGAGATGGRERDAKAAGATVVDGWRASPPAQRRRLVLGHVAGRARHVLGQDDTFVVDERLPLKEVGLDSLMAVELRNALTRSLGTSLPATLLFDHPSLDALATYLLTALDLQPDRSQPPSAPAAVATSLTADDEALLAMSDEEAEALLLAELAAPEGHP
jgi:acyl carrier protein